MWPERGHDFVYYETLRCDRKNPRPVLVFLGMELSYELRFGKIHQHLAEPEPKLWVKYVSSELVSGKKVKNVRHSRDATFENMT